METRKVTNKVLELAESGMISWAALALAALKWMSEDEVADMCKANDITLDFNED
jgi:hypothetical protein